MPRSLDFFVPCRPLPQEPVRLTRAVVPEAAGGSRRPAPGRVAQGNRRRKPRRSPFTRFLRAAIVLAAAAVVASALFPDVRHAAAAVLPGATPAEAFGAERVNILLLGADHDYDDQGRRVRGHGRSDTLILASLNLGSGTAHLLSIPRDTEAEIPGHGTRKINGAFSRGGSDLARASVERLTGLTVDYCVAVDLQAFVDAVDAVGGVEVDVEKPLRYTDRWAGLDIDIPAGRQRLDGEHAMQFVRFRNDRMADIGRARRQQEFLASLGRQMREPASMLAWPGVVRAVSRHTDTDLSPAQMIALGRFAREMESLTTETLPGSFHRSRWRPDPERMRRLAARLSD